MLRTENAFQYMLSNITGIKDISRDGGSNKNIKDGNCSKNPASISTLARNFKWQWEKNGGRICNSVYGLRRTRDTGFTNYELIFKALF